MNRITLVVLAFVAASGCATTNLEELLRQNAQLREELDAERRANADLAYGRTPAATPTPAPSAPAPAATAASAPVPNNGSVAGPVTPPAAMAGGVGYARVASPAYVATPAPWYGRSDATMQVTLLVNVQRYAIGMVVNGTVVPIGYGDAAFPTTLQVATPDGRLIPTPVVPPGTDDNVRVLVPRVGPVSLRFTCYVVAAGSGQPAASWTETVRIPSREVLISDLVCESHMN